ncbi:MAG: putative peptide chain release factor, class I [Nitrospira sp. OLB3]|nr:MAG: putative peptide chain release factor, class I [Nitrospira sp. OLB3]MCE7965905.1 aminoacyl-tRNA hydrolase [Nitrospira sp. NTP2]QOJ36513.1 MAG: aminoacyl-tRNA hydrolase [Nitrospira sp.]RIK60355.1 MAG: aminoacyl-tRNA hydrolase [Nitrospira sp.]
MLVISGSVTIPDGEIELSAVRSQGPGGQHVNKVSSAIHLRFNVVESSLPPLYKARLLALRDHRLSREGVITIKVQEFRSQERNRALALDRLRELILQATRSRAPRRPTKPTKGSTQRRLESKAKRARVKSLRGRPAEQ